MPEHFPVLQTSRLLLRSFDSNDLQLILTGLSHQDVIRYYGFHCDSLTGAQTQLDWYHSILRDQTGIWWAVCARDQGQFIGAIGFNNIKHENDQGEIGFWLMPEYWSKGITREIIPLICEYGFSHLGLQRIEAQVETENIRSKKVLLKNQFAHEKTLTDYELKNEKWISLDIFVLNKPDLDSIKPLKQEKISSSDLDLGRTSNLKTPR